MYNSIKQKSQIPIKLIHTEHRGYYLSSKSEINLGKLSEIIEDEIEYVSYKDKIVTFSTTIIASMNNRLK